MGWTWMDVYVLGAPGTTFQIQYDYVGTVAANAYRTTAIQAVIAYSSFADASVYVAPVSADSQTVTRQGVDAGVSSGPTIASAGATCSLARTYRIGGWVATNGQCCTCADSCCDCGLGSSASIVTLAVLP